MTTAARSSPILASRLNDACQCIWVDRTALGRHLREQLGAAFDAFPPSLVSGSVVFIEDHQAAAMDRTILLITRAIESPAFEERVARAAPAIARKPQPARGGLLGFDFHLGGADPQLIEINTNPGGLLVNLEIARAATASCECLIEPLNVMAAAAVRIEAVGSRVLGAFREEWGRARGARPLRTIAIVDDEPRSQYLYPEFLLYQRLLERAGCRVIVGDASGLVVDGQVVSLGGEPIDLVYNRCTDFYFAEDRHSALKAAYEQDLAVILPHPAAHARWADKRLLAWLRDDLLLAQAGLDDGERAHLRRTIPQTEIVERARADDFWARRKALFFKPVDGYGSKAAYRGDKLTRAAFDHILASRYVAQAIAPTSSRRVPGSDGTSAELHVDVRNFAMDGESWLRSARLYRGQTTNFRTAGGGFAPVLTLPPGTRRDNEQ